VQEALRVWVDGRGVGMVLEGDRRIPLLLRGEEGLRRSAADLARVQIALPAGGTVLLSQVADIREEEGAVQVIREQAERFATVLSNVRGRDIGGFVAEAQAAVAERVQIPPGYRLAWGGQFENQQRAQARLAIVVPIALGAIFLLLYLTFGSARQATLVFCNVPFALIGGVIALWASGEFVSVPASVGFLTLIGIAVLNGVVLISYINRLIAEEGMPLEQAVREGTKRRMTPVVLTALIAALALVPFLFATGPGSEIQRPLAIVVIGGLVTATVLTLVLLPILYERFAMPRVKALAVAAALAALMLPGVAPAQPQTPLSRHLDAALALDAGFRTLQAQRDAASARGATARSPIAGSPAVGGALRSGTQGPGQTRELDLEFAAPIWMPGQRGALMGTVESAVAEFETRIALRRLEVGGVLRETWWDAADARRSAQLARERLNTAREIARDVTRRAELGDIPPSEALLARNETLGAELALSQAEAAAAQARAAYRTLTGGMEPNLPVEALQRGARHPMVLTAQAALAHAEARQRLVGATPRDNPELGVFGRYEAGSSMSETSSVGLRFRIPLGTEGRNAPRRAEAESEVTRATAELAQAQRVVAAGIARAQAELQSAEAALRIARQRLAVANEQEGIALRAFRAGETGTFDLFRVRQLRLEAANDEGQASIAASRARSRVNQAAGVLP
jgi:outer membrane protein TolC